MILSEQELLRRQKRQELIGMGIDPYPAAEFLVSHHTSQILAEYKPELNNFQEVSLAGRLMGFRIMGNASFAELQDSNGRIQLYLDEMICAQERINPYTILYLNASWISVISLGSRAMLLQRK